MSAVRENTTDIEAIQKIAYFPEKGPQKVLSLPDQLNTNNIMNPSDLLRT